MLVGIPEQNLEADMVRLVEMREEVVLCQQKEDSVTCDDVIIPRYINGIYSRGVVGLGVLNWKGLDRESNYLYALHTDFARMGVLIVDTVNKVGHSHLLDGDLFAQLSSLAKHYPPAQVLVTDHRVAKHLREHYVTVQYYTLPSDDVLVAAELLLKRFLAERHLIQFWEQFAFLDSAKQCLRIPFAAAEQLHLEQLFGLLNRCASKDGARVLREWVFKPLRERHAIERRQRAVVELSEVLPLREVFSRELGLLKDVNRCVAQLYGYANTYHKALSEVSYKPFALLKAFLGDVKSLLITVKYKMCSNGFKSEVLLELLDHASKQCGWHW